MFNDPEYGQSNLTDHLVQSTAHAASQERSRIGSPPSTSGLIGDDGRSPWSIRSILSKTIPQKSGLGSAVQSKSNVRSKQSSPLLGTTSANDQSDSTHPAVPPTMDAVQQSQLDLLRDKDRQSDASSTWSYQTYAYGTPSPMTSRVAHGSEQNLLSGQDPSFVRQPSMLDSQSSANLPSEEKTSTRNITLGKTPVSSSTAREWKFHRKIDVLVSLSRRKWLIIGISIGPIRFYFRIP